jgi:hypothetical protein
MVAYGICQNTDCSRSYLNPALDSLRRRVLAAQTVALSTANFTPEMPDREYFEEFFQREPACSACGKPLCRVTQPTAGTDAEEYKRRVRLNGLLDVAGQLQAWGILHR